MAIKPAYDNTCVCGFAGKKERIERENCYFTPFNAAGAIKVIDTRC